MDRDINLATKDETTLVAACWLRKYISKTSKLHIVMADIIGKFTVDTGVIHLPFEWLDAYGYSVSNKGKRFVKSHKSSPKFIWAHREYTHDGVYTRWAVTLKRRKKHRSLEFMMGFVWLKRENLSTWDHCELKDGLAFWVKDGKTAKVFVRGESKGFYGHPPIYAKEGDVFRLDIEKGECRVYYNGRLIGLLTRRFPQKLPLRPAAKVNCVGASFETTIFARKVIQGKVQPRRRRNLYR